MEHLERADNFACTGANFMAEQQTKKCDEQMIVFSLGVEAFGIDIFRVNEIIRLRTISHIPMPGSHIRGLVNLRGKTVPVVDLRARLDLPEVSESEGTRIIVVDSVSGTVGVVVDSVQAVMMLRQDQIDVGPSLSGQVDTEFIRGVAKTEGGLITLLELDKVLAA